MNLTEEDIQFLEDFYTPKRLLEVLFHDFRNIKRYRKGKYGYLRFYQETMVSNEPLIDFDLTAEKNDLDDKEKFELRKNISDIYCMGARGFGKSLVVQILDFICDVLTDDKGTSQIFSAPDQIHLERILLPIKDSFKHHPFLKNFYSSLKCSPDFKFMFKSGSVLNSVNFNLNSKSPGDQFIGAHVQKMRIDETSRETDEVYDKRKDAVDNDYGSIQRHTGMTDFTPLSPAGKVYYDYENQKYVLNYPQFVSPYWNEKKKQEKIKEYEGQESLNYKIYVLGKIVEDGITALDMKRIRDNSYMLDKKGSFRKKINRFEITKNNFKFWKNLIVLSRPENAERIFVSSDIGKNVTELIIHSEVNNVFEYVANITLYNLTQQEIEEIFEYVIRALNAEVIAIDCGDGEGRGIFSNFELKFPKNNLVYYDGSMKIKVGYEYEETDDGEKEIKIEKGEPVYKYELMSDFSMACLKDILYNSRTRIPEDLKLDAQLSKVVITLLAGKSKYKCINAQGDHLFDAWRVFAIAVWLKQDFNDSEEIEDHNWGTGAIS